MRNFIFLVDLLKFFVYYKRKYDLEIDNAFRFTVNKYFLEDLEKIKTTELKNKKFFKNIKSGDFV